MNRSEQSVDVNGVQLHVVTAGRGYPLLMIHGLGLDASFDRPEFDAFSRSWRVIAPDVRGHGRSTRPDQYALADMVADLLGLLDALSIDRAHVLGASMGSYLAQGLAIAAPDRVSKLILVVAKASGTSSSSARYLAEHADEVAALSPVEQQRWLSERMFAPETGSAVRGGVADWMADQEAAGLALTPDQLQAANAALAGFDFRDQLPALTVPTLVISGRYDILNPPEEGSAVADLLPDARFVVFERSGHLLAREEPARYVEEVQRFLAD